MSEGEMALPSQDLFLESLLGVNLRWIVYCPNEVAQLGDSFATSEEAFNAATFHNQSTGHSAQAAPFFSQSAAGSGEVVAAAVDNELVAWPFCVLYNGSPYGSTTFSALTFEDADMSMAVLVEKMNSKATADGYPPLFSYQAGLCG